MLFTQATPKSAANRKPITLRIQKNGEESDTQHNQSEDYSMAGLIDQDIMVCEEKKPQALEFKDAVKFLRQALYSLDLEL